MTDTYTAADTHAAVERGAAWMDEHCPHWFERIDLEKLDLSNVEVCVLGQTATCLLPEWTESRFSPWFRDVLRCYALSDQWVEEQGFDIPFHGPNTAAYEMLTVAWKSYIRARLEALVPA